MESQASEGYGKMTAMKKVAIFMPAALSALLLWAAFPPLGETANVAFALVPLLVVARLCSPKRSALLWFVGGFLFWFGTLSWMPAIIKNNGPWPLVVLGWAGLAAACAGYFALYGWMTARVWRRWRRWGLLAEPILWAGCEWMRATLFTGFAWNFLGTAVGQVPSLATPARLGGVYLVSALVVLLNGVFATLACRVIAGMRRGAGPAETANCGKWRRQLIRSAETAVPLAVILLVFWLSQPGNPRLSTPNSQLLRVALVQRNAPCIFSAGRQRENPYEAYGQLLEVAAVARPDLVVWGESGMSEFGRVDGERARLAAAHFSEMLGGAALLAGGDWVEDGRYHNAAALYSGTNAVQLYAKQHLVPFGEYIPFDKWIPALQKLSPIGVSLWPGEAKVFRLTIHGRDAPESRSVALAPIICYEDTDPTLSRAAARLGAQAIVLITNDSWFSLSNEAVQHASQAVLRAIETGLPVIRVGNSGVTGVIDGTGRARWLSDGDGKTLVDAPGTMVETVQVPASPALTPYSRVGDWPLLALFAIALPFVFVIPRKEIP